MMFEKSIQSEDKQHDFEKVPLNDSLMSHSDGPRRKRATRDYLKLNMSKSCAGVLKTIGQNEKPLRIIIDGGGGRRNRKLAKTKSDFFITQEAGLDDLFVKPADGEDLRIPSAENKVVVQENEGAYINAYENIPQHTTQVNANIEKAHELLKSGMQKVKQLRMMVSETK
jgi:hypothetical protein